jgi:hypothetical protein
MKEINSLGKDLKDFGVVHHSAFMGNDPELKEFKAFIKDTSYTILIRSRL